MSLFLLDSFIIKHTWSAFPIRQPSSAHSPLLVTFAWLAKNGGNYSLNALESIGVEKTDLVREGVLLCFLSMFLHLLFFPPAWWSKHAYLLSNLIQSQIQLAEAEGQQPLIITQLMNLRASHIAYAKQQDTHKLATHGACCCGTPAHTWRTLEWWFCLYGFSMHYCKANDCPLPISIWNAASTAYFSFYQFCHAINCMTRYHIIWLCTTVFGSFTISLSCNSLWENIWDQQWVESVLLKKWFLYYSHHAWCKNMLYINRQQYHLVHWIFDCNL